MLWNRLAAAAVAVATIAAAAAVAAFVSKVSHGRKQFRSKRSSSGWREK